MKDRLHEQLSALVDEELTDQEQALLLKRLATDAGLQARLSRYQLISDTLQNHLPRQIDPAFSNRVQAALAAEPPARVRSGIPRALVKPVAGVAIAASVAMVAVLSLQSLRQDHPDAAPALAVAPAVPDRGGYLRAELPPPSAPLAQGLDVYLVNHNEYAANRGMQGMLPYVRIVGQEIHPENRK